MATTHHLHIRDRKTGWKFLVDTRVAISVIPRKLHQGLIKIMSYQLYAANSIVIKTYVVKTMTLDLGLRRNLIGNFCICEVDRPMIGADFLAQHGLLIDIKRQCIIDSLTQHTKHGSLKPTPQITSTIDELQEFTHTVPKNNHTASSNSE
ncbi:hypothetical protein ACFW04_013203 [Cataglyphis niger]